MKLKQAAFLVMGLLPLGVIAQPNTPPPSTPPLAQPGNVRIMPSTQPVALMPDKDKMSYAIGMNIANGIKREGLNIDPDTVAAALKDVQSGKPTRLTDVEYTNVMMQIRAAMQAKGRAEADEAKAKGEAFLSQYAKAAGVTTLPSGVEYKVIKEGTGDMPKENDSVTVAYRGTFIDGTEFDHSDSFPTPVRGRIIQGWQKVLPLMKTGSKWQVVIPSFMGYGPRGYPPKIPGNAVLIFELELKSITPGAPAVSPVASAPKSPPPAPTTPVVSGEIIKVPSADELKKGAKIEVIKAGQTNAVTPQ